MAPQTSTRMTYEDYLELPDDGKRYEVIEGELVVNASPIPRHQQIALRIGGRIDLYFENHGSGQVFVAPLDVVLADDVVLQPDVMIVSAARMQVVGPTHIHGAPDLVVEVLSDRTRKRDETVKRKLYERYGVNEYWIVDPAGNIVKIYRRDADSFTRVSEISIESGGMITSPLLPGFSLDIHDVFPRA